MVLHPRSGGVPPRALRSGVGAAVAVSVAAVAHVAAGGSVDLADAGWVFVALVGPAWWLARRERGWAVLAGAQLVAQQAAHLVLTVPVGAHDVHNAAGPLPMDLMLHAHLAAAALCGLWLRVGERRAWAAVRDVVRICVLLIVAGPSVEVASAPPRDATTAHPCTARLRHTLARRGPPAPAL